MEFSLISPQSIYFGSDKIRILPDLAKDYKGDILIVISNSASKVQSVIEILAQLESTHNVHYFKGVIGEPTVKCINECVEIARCNNVGLVISIGGGSVIDTAKAVAGYSPNDGDLIDYIEGVGEGRVLANAPIDHIAIPTTSGTGSEMTKNAVIMGDGDLMFKRSFRHDRMVPVASIVDPELTVSVPPDVTAYSGMDALTQLIESYISKKSKPVTDALALEAISRLGTSLIDAYVDGSNIKARTNLAYASMISGICLANSGLGAVHGVAAGMGAVCHAPHGMVCAILLAPVFRKNAKHILPEKITKLCKALTGKSTNRYESDIEAILNHIDNLMEKLNIPKDFNFLNITQETAHSILSSVSGSSMSGNPYAMNDEEILELINL